MNQLKEQNDWNMWIEKRVCAKGKFNGTLKYFGTTKFSDGLWCGIELDEPVGKNDGTVNKVKYFTCLPKFGIFVPWSKVQKIENNSKHFGESFMHLNGTYEVLNCREKTIILSKSDDFKHNNNKKSEEVNEIGNGDEFSAKQDPEKTIVLSKSDLKPTCSDKSKEISEAEKDEALNVKEDSEDSLGLLDPDLLESGDIFCPDFANIIDKNQTQDSNFFVPNELSNPRFASTPRHPVKKRFCEVNYNDMDLALPNIDESLELNQDVFFEKLKNNPNLTSTIKISEKIKTSPGAQMNINVLSPIQSNSSLQSTNVNKVEVISVETDQEIVPVVAVLNQTLTFQNENKGSAFEKVDSIEKDLNSTVSLQMEEVINISQKSCDLRAEKNAMSEVDCAELKVLNRTVSLESKEKSINRTFSQSEFQAETISETDSTETKNLNLKTSLEIREASKIYLQNTTLNGIIADIKLYENINLNATYDFSVHFADVKISESQVGVNEKSPFDQTKSVNYTSKTYNCDFAFPANKEGGNKSMLQKTFSLDSIPSEEEKNSKNALNNFTEFDSFDYKKKFSEETSTFESSLNDINSRKSVCMPVKSHKHLNSSLRFSNRFELNSTFKKKSEPANSCSASLKNLKSVSNNKLKRNDNDEEFVFKKPISTGSRILKFNAPSKNIASNISKTKSGLKENKIAHSVKTLVSEVKLESSEQHEENTAVISAGNKFALTPKSLVSNINSKTCVKSVANKKKISAFNLDNKINVQTKAIVKPSSVASKSIKGRLSSSLDLNCKIYKQSGATVEPRHCNSQSTERELEISFPQKVDNKENYNIAFSNFPEESPSNNLNISTEIKDSLNNTKVLKINSSDNLVKNHFSQLKQPAKGNKLRFSTFPAPTNGCGIPRRNSLAASSKTNLPVGIIRPRYSMLPLKKEKIDVGANVFDEQHNKSNDILAPEPVNVARSCAESNSSKTTRIASSLPRKSLIATKQFGLKYTDPKKENSASPKVPRYNLRRK